MDAFFTTHAFPLPSADTHPHAHFLALLASRNWAAGSRNYRRAHAAFHAALMDEFRERFGDAPRPDLAAWQNLCVVLGAKEVPGSITKCKKLVKRTHINLVDLMAGKITVFKKREEMMAYTEATKRYFPRNQAKAGAGGLLRCLLREMPELATDVSAADGAEAGEGVCESEVGEN